MSFKSINSVLGHLGEQYKLHEQRKFQKLLGCWAEVVGTVVAAQTRPTSVHRNVLYVATSSAPWAQNLVFERQRILEKLNAVLSYSLIDIRFSTAQWQSSQVAVLTVAEEQVKLWQNHPCRVEMRLSGRRTEYQDLTDPVVAFQNWAKLMRSRSQHLPQCPQCSAPTPIGELERWKVCALCVTKRW